MGLGVPAQAPVGVTENEALQLILKAGRNRPGFTLNRMHGTPGCFYRERRADNVRELCLELLRERTMNNQEQPAPTPNDNPSLWDAVIEDMRQRDQLGRARYGTPVQVNNGRDSLRDLYEELLDAVVYCRQVMEENPDHEDGLKLAAENAAARIQVRSQRQCINQLEADLNDVRASHAKICHAVKRALGLEHWPDFPEGAGIHENVERLIREALSEAANKAERLLVENTLQYNVPPDYVVRCCEGGGAENPVGTLALTVSKMAEAIVRMETAKALEGK